MTRTIERSTARLKFTIDTGETADGEQVVELLISENGVPKSYVIGPEIASRIAQTLGEESEKAKGRIKQSDDDLDIPF
jgi:hypothetical protein